MLIGNKYEVLAEIGRGGMGVVYKVRHTSLHTISALKILPAHLASDPDLVARFHREARVMAQLHHPNVVRVIDVDKSDDLHYFVMEYVEGCSLSHWIAQEGPLSLATTLDVASQVIRAVAYAHGRQPSVIHRDIKPSNILIETETGQFLGTLRYCAPEQLTGVGGIDGRVDVYALGMVLYEMVAGRSAYAQLERPHVIAGLLQATVEHPFQFEARVPETLREVIRRATAKDREQRCQTAAELLADVDRLRADDTTAAKGSTLPGSAPSVGAAGAARSRSRTLAVGTALALGVAVAAAMVVRDSLLPKREGRGIAADGGAPGGAKADRDGARTFISVMDFSAGSPNGDLDWMRGAIRDNLNSRLSASPDCKVFSKEFIDFKAQQMVRENEYRDVKAATMEVAQRLGVTKAVLGSFRADHDVLHIEAHLVDMETGVQEASEIVEGSESRFAELQAALARKLMARLGVAAAPETEPVQAAESNADLDDYRLLLQAEGQGGTAEPMPAATGVPGRDRHGSLRVPLGVAAAYAAASDDATLAAEEQIRATLERYRRACEHKDLAELQEVYQQLSPPQIEANRRYFANARDLTVSFEEIDVAVGGDEAAVSYTRKDNFVDNGTARPTKVEVRLTKMMVRVDGAWKLVSTAPKK